LPKKDVTANNKYANNLNPEFEKKNETNDKFYNFKKFKINLEPHDSKTTIPVDNNNQSNPNLPIDLNKSDKVGENNSVNNSRVKSVLNDEIARNNEETSSLMQSRQQIESKD
jgi:hypothetical protein